MKLAGTEYFKTQKSCKRPVDYTQRYEEHIKRKEITGIPAAKHWSDFVNHTHQGFFVVVFSTKGGIREKGKLVK